MSKKNENVFLTAFPTMPFQDNLGQIVMQAGMSKLEFSAVQIAAQIYLSIPLTTPAGQAVDPESIAQEATLLAKAVLAECEKEFDKFTKPALL